MWSSTAVDAAAAAREAGPGAPPPPGGGAAGEPSGAAPEAPRRRRRPQELPPEAHPSPGGGSSSGSSSGSASGASGASAAGATLVPPPEPLEEEERFVSASALVPVGALGHPSFAASELVPCKVAQLGDWLARVTLQEYHLPASKWCAEMGAASLEEIAENIQDFSDAVALKPIERQRVQKWAAQLLREVPGWRLDEHAAADKSAPAGAFGDATAPQLEGSIDDLEQSSHANHVEVLAPRSVRLAMDSRGSTGLDLQWDPEWGILVQGVDPLPGQPGLAVGDYIIAINGCSLRHRMHEECNRIFTQNLQDGAILSTVALVRPSSASMCTKDLGGVLRRAVHVARPEGKGEPKGKGTA